MLFGRRRPVVEEFEDRRGAIYLAPLEHGCVLRLQQPAVCVENEKMRVTRNIRVRGEEFLVLILLAVVDLYPNVIFISRAAQDRVSDKELVHITTPAAPFAADVENDPL